MCSKIVIILFLIRPIIEQSLAFILDTKLNYSDCESICSASEGKAEFDIETKMCKCLLKKNIDDTDIELMNKTAKILGKQLNKVSRLDHATVIIKREVAEDEELQDDVQTEASTSTERLSEMSTLPTPDSVYPTTLASASTNKEDEEVEEIVGQPRRRIHHRLVAQRRHPPRPITPEQQRFIVQQMRDHLNRLSQTTDPRLRQIEVDAIRANLRQLSQTTATQTPQQRSRMRNIVEETRRRQHRQRLLHNAHLVGAPQNEDSALKKEVHDVHENDVESALKEIFHHKTPPHFDIVTQDPSLIDE